MNGDSFCNESSRFIFQEMMESKRLPATCRFLHDHSPCCSVSWATQGWQNFYICKGYWLTQMTKILKTHCNRYREANIWLVIPLDLSGPVSSDHNFASINLGCTRLHPGHHTEMADAKIDTAMCYASNCNTLVTTPSTASPTLQVWASCSLSHNSLEGEGRKLAHITTPLRQFLMAAPPPWPDRVWHMLQWRLTGRQTQRNIRGALALKQSIVKGNPALPMTHLDDTRRTKCSVVLLSYQLAALYHSTQFF